MKRLTLTAGVMLAVSIPGVANAKPVTPRHARQYTRVYHRVAAKLGRRAAGRNIVRWGALGHAATDAEVVTSIGVLDRMLTPQLAVTPVAGSVTAAVGSVTPVTPAVAQASNAGTTAAGGTPIAGASAASAGSPLPPPAWWRPWRSPAAGSAGGTSASSTRSPTTPHA